MIVWRELTIIDYHAPFDQGLMIFCCSKPLEARNEVLSINLGPVVQRLGNAIHRINHYPVDSAVCFANTYPLDSDLSGG